MIDILVYLFSRYDDFASRPEPASLVRKLKAAGFEDEDISEAMHWLSALRPDDRDASSIAPRADSLRVWADEEMQKLGVDGLGFLTFLSSAGVLTPELRETIVERVLALDETPLPLSKLKVVTLMVLWSRERDLESLLIEELLVEPGDQTVH